ncbi:hypothetical protein MANES_13G066148v8 [Manihot esculenta]|uniref:Uncharacterized protein n=1 Tax=Manihot esculenta TaxID=3983 RepID=A0ACB7GK21_MANES|nr:hypothetical protein MANES_13G066148v8 [Manihot esculenta]
MGLKPTIPAFLDPAYNISDFASVIPLWKQLEFYKDYQRRLRGYLGESKASQTISEALHLISIGTNDFVENHYAFPGRSAEYSITGYQNFLAGIAENFLRKLYGLGAQKISFGGLPPMEFMPMEGTANIMSGYDCVESYNNVAMEFNGKLYNLVAKFNKELAEIKLIFSNPYYIFLHIIRNRSLYGR